MSRLNPRKAMAAILPLPVKAGKDRDGNDITVRPLTLGMWAALERIGSPLVSEAEPKDALELLPSLYLLTHDPREVFRQNIVEAAMAWADTVPVETLSLVRRACYRQMNAAFDVMPERDDEEDGATKKEGSAAMTASSPRSRNTPRKATAGATGKSCGKRRSRRSACSGGAAT